MTVLKILAFQLAWLGSIAVYLTARQQAYLPRPLSKRIAWLAFGVSNAIALLLLLQMFHGLTAGVFLLLIWTLTWITLALWSPHYSNPKVVFSVGTLLVLFSALMGGSHVV